MYLDVLKTLVLTKLDLALRIVVFARARSLARNLYLHICHCLSILYIHWRQQRQRYLAKHIYVLYKYISIIDLCINLTSALRAERPIWRLTCVWRRRESPHPSGGTLKWHVGWSPECVCLSVCICCLRTTSHIHRNNTSRTVFLWYKRGRTGQIAMFVLRTAFLVLPQRRYGCKERDSELLSSQTHTHTGLRYDVWEMCVIVCHVRAIVCAF